MSVCSVLEVINKYLCEEECSFGANTEIVILCVVTSNWICACMHLWGILVYTVCEQDEHGFRYMYSMYVHVGVLILS